MVNLVTPTGMRDFPPEEEKIRKHMIKTIEDIFTKYGYQPLSTPAMETLEVLKNKGGEEIEDQIFIIRGEDIGLRFDLTVPLARFVASNLAIKKPFKRYAIDKVWRNEEAQKARYREFIQADADIVGVKHPSAEVELLNMALEALNALGVNAKPEHFLINDRAFLYAFTKTFNIKNKAFFRGIDKLDKIGEEGVIKELSNINKEAVEAFMELNKERNNEEALQFIAKYSKEAYERLSYIIDHFKATIRLNLVRGLDYYTGTIYECKISNEIGSIAGGGRYDKLLSLYGYDDAAVGISLGFERIYYLIKNNHKKEREGIYIAFTKGMFEHAFKLAQSLRKKFIIDTAFEGMSLKKQLDYANKQNYRFVIIVAKKEFEQGKLILKDLENGSEELINKEALINVLKNK